jgi:hypothetical protein
MCNWPRPNGRRSTSCPPRRRSPRRRSSLRHTLIRRRRSSRDVGQYIPAEATTATIILTLSPPTGWALVYTEGSEDNGTVFKGGSSVGEIKLDGRYVYVKLYGPTSFSIKYINYHVP